MSQLSQSPCNETRTVSPKIRHMVSAGSYSVEDGSPTSPSDYQRIFSTPCKTCETDHSWQDKLCQKCIQMRLLHLISCLRLVTTEDMPLLDLGTLEELRERESCRFCSMVAHMFDTTRRERLRLDATIFVFPRVAHLAARYRRTVVEPEKGVPDLLFFMPHEHSSDLLLQMGTERYAMVAVRENQQNAALDVVPASTGFGDGVNWPRITAWVEDSLTNREDRTLGETTKVPRLPRNFRLLDVRRSCLTEAPENPVYVALSYVWGLKLPDEVESTLDNVAQLSEPGRLGEIDLPGTIRDALTFCRRFDVPYLWVDRLCIVQDDAAQKHDQISAMDAIYSLAVFTICASAGNSSRAALPGIGRPRLLSRLNAWISNYEILPIMPSMGHSANEGTWVERGWTYQESLLGGNLLVFTEHQAFRRFIDGSNISEDDLTDRGDVDGWFEEVAPNREVESRWKSMFAFYKDYLNEYSMRTLSYASDTYNAFAGAYKFLYADLDGYIYGLPEPDFDVALVWNVTPKADLTPPTPIENVVLPTWSWGSLIHWAPEVRCGLYDTIASVAKWARCDANGNFKPIIATNDPTLHLIACGWDIKAGSVDKAIDPRPYVLAAWRTCIEAPVPRLYKLRLSSTETLLSRWPRYAHFWREAHGNPSLLKSNNTLHALRAKPGRIAVRTTIKRLRVWAGPTIGFSQDFFILDDDGWCLGICRLPIAIARANRLATVSGSNLERYDFLALSLRFSREVDFFENLDRRFSDAWLDESTGQVRRAPPMMSKEVPPPILVQDRDGKNLNQPLVLTVMMVGWKDNVAHRICLGWASLARWMRTGPVHDTVVLE